MNISNIRKELENFSDRDYAKFNKKSCPDTSKKIIGIKIPQLRNLAKQLVKTEYWRDTINEFNTHIFEETILKGLVIAYSKISIEEKILLIKEFLPNIDSWAITDTFCPTLKVKQKDLDIMWKFILPYAKSNKEFEARFAIIMMLDYYIIEDYIDKVIKVIDEIQNDAYYVQMAKAWIIAEIGIKFNEKAMNYLEQKNNLDKFTYNKSLQKMIESYRIPNEQKLILRKMKRKD